jgi:transcriptional regulator with XRE-family HTH domain
MVAVEQRAPKGTPRAVFGQMMRFYRERAGLTRIDLGSRISMSESTIISYETGWRVPQRDNVALIDAVPDMQTKGALTELWDELEEGMTYQILPAEIQDWDKMVQAKAATLRWYEQLLVPGLLQTEDYMRTIVSTQFGITSKGIEEQVAAKLRRQEILLREKPPILWIIIDEAVLHHPVGGSHVMLEQLNQLIEAARQPYIRIQVIPATTITHEGLNGPFIIAGFEDEPSIGRVQTAVGSLLFKDRENMATLDLTWSILRGETLPRGASLAMLEEAANARRIPDMP